MTWEILLINEEYETTKYNNRTDFGLSSIGLGKTLN
jgi:hypothetical protein